MGGTTIGNTIRALRFNSGEMSQQELADKVGVARQTINAIEGRKYSPTLELAFRISRVFKKPLEEVFIYQEEEHE
jgi:putative transcriptional regulator